MNSCNKNKTKSLASPSLVRDLTRCVKTPAYPFSFTENIRFWTTAVNKILKENKANYLYAADGSVVTIGEAVFTEKIYCNKVSDIYELRLNNVNNPTVNWSQIEGSNATSSKVVSDQPSTSNCKKQPSKVTSFSIPQIF